MTPTKQNLEMVRGDTLSFDLNMTELSEGSVTSIFFSAKKKISDEEYAFRKSLGDGIEATGENSFYVRVAPEDTAHLEPGRYQYDLQIGIGTDIVTPLMGQLKIQGDVTVMDDGD